MDYAYFDKSPETVNWLYTALLIFMGRFWFVIFFSLILIVYSMQETSIQKSCDNIVPVKFSFLVVRT